MRRALLALLLAVADAALALAYEAPPAWALLVLPMAALVGLRQRVPPRLDRALLWASRAGIALVAVRGDDFGFSLGLALGVLAGLFLLDQAAFPIGAAFLPAALGVLLAAASRPVASHFVAIAWATTALVSFWLFTAAPRAGSARRVALLLPFAVVTAAIGASLIAFLPWAQPHIEQAVVEYIQPSAAEAGLSFGPRLGDIEELALSQRVVMRLWSDLPMNLRIGVYTEFDGHAWKISPQKQPPVLLARQAQTLGPDFVESTPGGWHVRTGTAPTSRPTFARMILDERPATVLPAPAGVDAVKATEDLIRIDADDLVLAPPNPLLAYAVRAASWVATGTAGPDDLSLPAYVDARMRALADSLAAGASSTSARIEKTASYLRTHYRYSLKVGRFQTGDPISEFLFDKKKGYCEYFATATVLLLRLQGVPARYVNGLAVRDDNRFGNHYLVRASDAHAWAEAFVPDVGWVEVDSTPPGDYAAVHASGRGRWASLWEAVCAFADDVMAQVRQGGWAALQRLVRRGLVTLLPWALVVVLLAIAARVWRRHRRRPVRAVAASTTPIAAELADGLRRLDAIWSAAGCARPPHRALIEHALSLPDERVDREMRALGLRFADCFYRGAYGGRTVDRDEIAGLLRALDAARDSSIRSQSHDN